jgi:predicted GNAT family N-acyltransferase
MLIVQWIDTPEELEKSFAIRKKVFVDEQKVAEAEEFDEFEDASRHFLALYEGMPCGTARWRYTEKGVKLERFCVLPEFRSQKVGSALVQALLDDIASRPESAGKLCYLHAQVTAMPLYAKFGFSPVGEMFEECDIPHTKMVKS